MSMATSQIIIGCNDDLNMIYKWDMDDDLVMMVAISLVNPTVSIYIYNYIHILGHWVTIYCNVVNPIINYPITAISWLLLTIPKWHWSCQPWIVQNGGLGVTLKISWDFMMNGIKNKW